MKRGKVFEYSHQPADLVLAMAEIQNRAERKLPPPRAAFREIVQHEPYPVESKARDILQKLKEGGHHPLFAAVPGQPEPQRGGGHLFGGAGAVQGACTASGRL